MKIRELRQKRAKAIADARSVLEAAERENRGMTPDEEQQWNGYINEADGLNGRIDQLERQEALDAEMAENLDNLDAGGADGQQRGHDRPQYVSRTLRNGNVDLRHLAPYADPAYRSVFGGWMVRGNAALAGTQVRALQADSDIAGGYLYAPISLVDRLIQAMDDQVFIRQWATVFAVTDSESLGFPSLDADPADADWTSELATGDEDTTMNFGRRALTPRPLAKRIKISRKLLMKAPDSEALVTQRLGYKFGISFEKAGMTGSGAGQPLGVFTADNNGISTSRDYSTGATTTAMTFDQLIGAKYTLKGGYWPRARWLFHRDALKQIAQLKDSNNQYIWRESARAGEPDMLLGMPTFMSEYAPNTFTASQYVGMLADFSYYWIADSLQMEMQRLSELYAETNQIGLIGRMESDGMPVLQEAFVRLKLAAS